jgi:hypothetical protein
LTSDISDSDSLLETAPADTELPAETIAVARHHFTLGAWLIAFNVLYQRSPFPDTQSFSAAVNICLPQI